MDFYCVKCRTKKSTDDYEETTLKNGRKAAKASCPDCQTNMFKIMAG